MREDLSSHAPCIQFLLPRTLLWYVCHSEPIYSDMLRWPKISLGFFHQILRKTRMNFWANPILLLIKICALFGLPQSPPRHVLFLFQNLMLDATFQLVNPQPSVPPGCDGFPDVSHLGDLDNLESSGQGSLQAVLSLEFV